MNKSIYSEKELEQLFQNLFIEKKKVIELEQKLEILHQEHQWLLSESKQLKTLPTPQKNNESEEIEKLKSMIVTYKKKSAQAIHAFYENEHQKIKQETTLALQLRQMQTNVLELTEENAALLEQQKQLRARYEHVESELKIAQQGLRRDSVSVNDNKLLRAENQELSRAASEKQKHSEYLERALNHLHERSREAHLELNQLREDFQKSTEAVSNLTEQLQLSQSHLHERTGELTKIQTEKQEALSEIHALQAQFSGLKAKVIEGQEALKTGIKEKIQLESLLADKTDHFNQLENEVSTIKQALTKGMNEAKDIEGRYLGVVNEKAVLYNKSAHLEQLIERHNSEIKTLQDRLEEATSKEDAFKLQFEQHEAAFNEKHNNALKDLQKRIQDLEISLQKHHDLLHHKEQQIEDNNSQLSLLTQEKYKLEDTLANSTRYQEELDVRIKVAQQHLGKKVKEVALMNEKMEEQKAQIADLQGILTELKDKMAEMQTSFEQKVHQEKKQQEQLHETVRFTEAQVAKWEDKYLKTYENLKVLEEKQRQMQALFSSLGNVMGTHSMPLAPIVKTTPLSSTSYTPQKNTLHLVDTQNIQQQNLEEHRQQDKESSTASAQPSLFDFEQPRLKIRQNLFD